MPIDYKATYQLNAEVVGKANVDVFNKALEVAGQRVGVAEYQLAALSSRMRTLTDQGLSLARALQEIGKQAKAAGDLTTEGLVNQVKRAIAEIRRELNDLNPNNPNPGGGSGGGYSALFGRVGGRVIGAEVLGRMGVPGGGFIGSQLAYGLGVSGSAAYGVLGAAAGILGIYEFAKHTNDTLKYAQAQRNLSNELGISIQQMDTFSRISEVTGVHLESSAKAVSKLAEEMMTGRARASEISQALSQLGLDAKVAFESPDKAMRDIAAGLAKIKDTAERTRIAELLGVKDLAAIADQLPKLEDKLKVDPETSKRLAEAKDNIDLITQKLSIKWTLVVDWVVRKGEGVNDLLSAMGAVGQVAFDKLVGPGLTAEDARDYGRGPVGSINLINRAAIALPLQNKHPLLGQLDLAGMRKESLDAYYAAIEKYGTPEDRHSAIMSRLNREEEALKGGYSAPTEDVKRIESQKRSENLRYQREKEIQSQLEELRRLPKMDTLTPSEQMAQAHKILTGFPDIRNTSQYRAAARESLPVASAIVRADIDQSSTKDFDRVLRAAEAGDKDSQRELSKFYSEQQRDAGIYTTTAEKQIEDTLRRQRTSTTSREAQIGLNLEIESVQRRGQRFGMSARAIARMEYEDEVRAIHTASFAREQGLLNEAATLRGGASQLNSILDRTNFPNTPEGDAQRSALVEKQARLIAEAEQKEAEARNETIKSITETTSAVGKFNESLTKAAEDVRNQFSDGIVSVMLGAQRGAYSGQAGRGAASAARAFGEKLEGQLLTNIIGRLVYGDPKKGTGAGGVLSRIGAHLPDWLTQGTILQKIDSNAELKKNTDSTDKNTAALERNTSALTGGKGASIDPTATLPLPIQVLGAGGALGLPGMVMQGFPGASGSSSTPSLSSPSTISGVIGSIFSGMAAKGMISQKTADDLTGAASLAAGGGLLYEGISSISKNSGNARTKVAGAGELAGGIGAIASGLSALGVTSKFLSELGPIGALAGVGLGLVSSFFPDPRTVRSQEIEKNMFTHAYTAPPSIHMMAGDNAGYADFDMFGNVRTSNLSPYPVAQSGYEDVPRRTIIPGTTTSQFGGGNLLPPSALAQTPPPIYQIHIHAMDAKSIMDRAGDIVDAVHKGLNSGHHELINTVGQKLGLR